MANARPSEKYWDDRATQRFELAEKGIEPSLADIDRIYKRAEQQVLSQINTIYRTYAKSTGIDVDELLKKLSIEETHAFWLKMRAGGNLEYITANYQARITRLEQMKGEIYDMTRRIADLEVDVHNDSHPKTINDTYYRNIYDTSKGLNVDISFSKLNTETLDTLLREKWYGQNYSERVWGNTNKLATEVKDLLGSALLTGKNPSTLSADLVERFGVSTAQAKRLLRTETNYVQNQADALSSDAIGLDKYKYLATLDTRTSLTCRSHDDKIYLFKNRVIGVNFPPLHPNCRSTTRAYLGEEYEPKERRARDLTTGKSVLVPNQSYEKWASANDVLNPPKVEPQKATRPKNRPATATSANVLNGVEAGKPMTPEVAVAGVNPNFSKGGVWRTNCQKTVPTYELRRRGYDMTALPHDHNSSKIGYNSNIPKIWGQEEMDYRSYVKEYTAYDGTKRMGRSLTNKREVQEHLLTYPEGARVQMTYKYVRYRSAHTIAVERVPVSKEYPKGLMYVDPQSGTITPSIVNHPNYKGLTNFAIIRMDNRPIETSLIPIIAKGVKE